MPRFHCCAAWALLLVSALGLALGCKPSSSTTAKKPSAAAKSSDAGAPIEVAEPTAQQQPDSVPMTPLQPAPNETPDAGQTEPPAITLNVGDPAPSLAIGQWYKGEPVTAFAADHVYVVEFWATWCGPCRVSMPHIGKLQEQYPDQVTFIGVSDESEDTVREFMSGASEDGEKTWDELVTYTIALDDKDATGTAYMKAAGQNGIPTAFIVGKDGHIEWIGHPMAIDEPLAQVVAGQWDRQKAVQEQLAQRAAEEAMMKLREVVQSAQQSGDWTAALAMIDEMAVQQPRMLSLKLQMLLFAEKFDDAHVLAEELVTQNAEDANMLNEIAWILATRVPRDKQKPELALRIAKQASSLRNDQDASTLDTVARVYYLQGNLEEAVAWQTKAVAAAPEGAKKQLQSTLDAYQAELTPNAPETGADAVAPPADTTEVPQPPAEAPATDAAPAGNP